MGEDNFKIWDLAFKIITSILTLTTIVVGINQYVKNSEKEFRKELYYKQMDIYMETSQLVSKLANFPKNEIGLGEYNEVRQRFFEIQYGPLYMLQDTIVEKACLEFTRQLGQYERPGSKVQQEDMQFVSLKVNQAFRKSIQNTWGIDLPILNRSKDDKIQ
jgi:hypothetical protein